MSPSRQEADLVPASRPGRPAKRQVILDAAKGAFLRYGFTDTSLDVVATEAGVSKQTIYNHFGDKERLFHAVIHAVQTAAAREAEVQFAERFTETGDIDRDLRATGRLAVRIFLSEDVAALRRLVIAEYARHPGLIEEWARARPGFEQAVVAEIERHVELGILDVPDPELAARQYLMLVVYEAGMGSLFGLKKLADAEIDKLVDEGVDLWLRAYRTR